MTVNAVRKFYFLIQCEFFNFITQVIYIYYQFYHKLTEKNLNCLLKPYWLSLQVQFSKHNEKKNIYFSKNDFLKFFQQPNY